MSSCVSGNVSNGSENDNDPPTYELKLQLDRCKIYPANPLAILAGNVVETESNFLQPNDRCLVHVVKDVDSLLQRWGGEIGNKKCTGWIKLAAPVLVTCRIRAGSKESPLERNRMGIIILECHEIVDIDDPPTYQVKMLLEQFKFYPTKLGVLDGSIVFAESNFHNPGQYCSVHIRSNVLSLMKTLGVAADEERNATGWIKLSAPLPVTFQIIYTETVEKNRKGAMLLECNEIIEICKPEDFDVWRTNDRSFRSNDSLLVQDLRTERHRIFAEWLVRKFGIEALCSGSGVLDVAGGKGEFSLALSQLGVKSVLLDPDPRCNIHQVPFKIISQPLEGDGSHLTDRSDEISQLVKSCSVIAGMHPDQATEAIVDMSLRLGIPFAVLPCCVMPKLFPDRVQKRHGDPVRSYSTFCQYLLDKAPVGVHFEVEHLPFQGRNKVIYVRSFVCSEIDR